MLHNFLNPIKQATTGLNKPSAPRPLSKCPWPSISNSQTRFTAWLHLGIPKASTGNSHLIWLIAYAGWPRAKYKWELTLAHLGNSRTYETSGQLQTMSEYHQPASAQLILHRRCRLVVNGHSQSLQLTGLDKSLPLTSQQQ